jgi:hypothetical protein
MQRRRYASETMTGLQLRRAETARSVGAKSAKNKSEGRLLDIRFTIAAALALGLPALMGAAVYLAITIARRLS